MFFKIFNFKNSNILKNYFKFIRFMEKLRKKRRNVLTIDLYLNLVQFT